MAHLLTLIAKEQCSRNVWKLTYRSSVSLNDRPGQFLLCDCDSGDIHKMRNYSINDSYPRDDGSYVYEFIIKKETSGSGGSRAICDQVFGHTMTVHGPLGDFIVHDTSRAKLFIGTGTGYAPLHFQMKSRLISGSERIHFLYGVRDEQDVFCGDYFEQLRCRHLNFTYQICLSRPESSYTHFFTGYVTDILTDDYLTRLGFAPDDCEAYICGSPSMVRDARARLQQLMFPPDHIIFEQY